MFRNMEVRFLKQEVVPVYDDWEREHIMPKAFWRAMGEAGLLLVDMPEQYGTAGAEVDVCMMIQEEMAKLGFFTRQWLRHPQQYRSALHQQYCH